MEIRRIAQSTSSNRGAHYQVLRSTLRTRRSSHVRGRLGRLLEQSTMETVSIGVDASIARGTSQCLEHLDTGKILVLGTICTHLLQTMATARKNRGDMEMLRQRHRNGI